MAPGLPQSPLGVAQHSVAWRQAFTQSSKTADGRLVCQRDSFIDAEALPALSVLKRDDTRCGSKNDVPSFKREQLSRPRKGGKTKH